MTQSFAPDQETGHPQDINVVNDITEHGEEIVYGTDHASVTHSPLDGETTFTDEPGRFLVQRVARKPKIGNPNLFTRTMFGDGNPILILGKNINRKTLTLYTDVPKGATPSPQVSSNGIPISTSTFAGSSGRIVSVQIANIDTVPQAISLQDSITPQTGGSNLPAPWNSGPVAAGTTAELTVPGIRFTNGVKINFLNNVVTTNFNVMILAELDAYVSISTSQQPNTGVKLPPSGLPLTLESFDAFYASSNVTGAILYVVEENYVEDYK